MKNIIILGEEYWFNIDNNFFTEATYLLKYLESHRDKTKYNYFILQNPKELINTIEQLNINTIKAIFLFQDILSDSYLNKKSILEMKNYIINLQSKGIYIYPPPSVIDNFGSKKYNLTLNQKLSWASLPHTQVYYLHNYDPKKDENKIFTNLYKKVQELWYIFKKVIIKKGYSYESKQVQFFNRELITNFNEFKKKALKLNYKHFWGIRTSSIKIDEGITRYYIIQGFNNIISKKLNEYRIFFHNGKVKFIAKGTNIPNTCIEDEIQIPLVKAIINFAKKLFKEYIPLFWNQKRLPILFRIDVSYAIDPVFQDQYSINIDGFDTPVRIYANELEIDPTSFFYNEFICNNNDNFNSKTIQKNLAKYITKYIKSL